MPDEKLVTYVQKQIEQGYAPHVIHNALLSYGYPEKEVDAAVHAAVKGTKHASLHSDPIFLYGVFLVVIAAIFIPITVFVFAQESEEGTELRISSEQPSVAAGSALRIATQLDPSKTGTAGPVEVQLEAVNSETQEVTQLPSHTLDENVALVSTEVIMPATLQPGNYLIRAKIMLNSKQIEATLPVTIIDPETDDTEIQLNTGPNSTGTDDITILLEDDPSYNPFASNDG